MKDDSEDSTGKAVAMLRGRERPAHGTGAGHESPLATNYVCRRALPDEFEGVTLNFQGIINPRPNTTRDTARSDGV
jgi:hypothetical protein